MIDTGQSNMESAVLDIFGRNRLKWVILTHHHEDHSGNVFALKEKYGAVVMGHHLTASIMLKVKPILSYRRAVWGQARSTKIETLPEVVETNNFSLFPIHTPGHSIDHTVYIEKNRGWLFSGDIYLANKVRFFHLDENITAHIESLRKILLYDFNKIFCSHNPIMKNGKKRVRRKLAYLEDFLGCVSRYAEDGMMESGNSKSS